ncbi:hypothetical protein MBLNU13_g08841t1 [Cladosporium sp. NU13]
MKLHFFYATLLVTSFSAIGLADISLDALPLRLYTGDSCELHWRTDRDYTLELLLVRRFDEDGLSGWSPVKTIFENRTMAAGGGSYTWTVPDVEEHDVLWLSGSESPSSGYANITNRFHVESVDDHDAQLASFGEIAGAVAGFVACLIMFAAATAALLRLMREGAGHIQRIEYGEDALTTNYSGQREAHRTVEDSDSLDSLLDSLSFPSFPACPN